MNHLSERVSIPREEKFMLRLLIARVDIINMGNPHEMVREIVDIARTLTNWGMKELSAVEVVVKLHEFLQMCLGFIWFSQIHGVGYDSIRNRVSVSQIYLKSTENVRYGSNIYVIN